MTALRSKVIDDRMHARLLNWGRWLRYDSTIARLGYPWKSPFVFSPSKGQAIADLDAEHIEWVVSSLACSDIGRGRLLAFVLKVEYAERPDGQLPAVEQRAKDVSLAWKMPCSRRGYYNLLSQARAAVSALADDVK